MEALLYINLPDQAFECEMCGTGTGGKVQRRMHKLSKHGNVFNLNVNIVETAVETGRN